MKARPLVLGMTVIAIAVAVASFTASVASAAYDPAVGSVVRGQEQCNVAYIDGNRYYDIWGNAPYVKASSNYPQQMVRWDTTLYLDDGSSMFGSHTYSRLSPTYTYYSTAYNGNWNGIFWYWSNNAWNRLPGSPVSYRDFGNYPQNHSWASVYSVWNSVWFQRSDGSYTNPVGFWSEGSC